MTRNAIQNTIELEIRLLRNINLCYEIQFSFYSRQAPDKHSQDLLYYFRVITGEGLDGSQGCWLKLFRLTSLNMTLAVK